MRMDRIGQKGVLAAVPHARDKVKASEGEVPFDIGGTVKRRCHHLKYTTTLLGHTRVLEVGDFHGAVTGTTRLASEPDTAGSAVLLHALVRIGAPPSHSRGSSHQGLGVSLLDESRHELLYACAQRLAVSFSATAESLLINGKVSRLQVDNQTSNGPRIALVSPWQSDEAGNFLDADLELARSVTSVSYWRHVRLSTGCARLQLHESVLWGLLQFEQACYSPSSTRSIDADKVDAAEAGKKGKTGLAKGVRHAEASCDPETGRSPEVSNILSDLAFLDDAFLLDSGMHFEEITLPKVSMEVTLQGLQAVRWRPHQMDHDDQHIRVFGDTYAQLSVLAASSLGLPDVEGHRMTLPELRCTDWSTAAGSSLTALIWSHYRKTVMMQGLKVTSESRMKSALGCKRSLAAPRRAALLLLTITGAKPARLSGC